MILPRSSIPPSTTAEGVSVCLTVLNERGAIERFLDSLANQSAAPALIVIVDGGSTDGTVELCESWAPYAATPARVLRRPGASISAGRNEAIRHAVTEWVAVTDAGTILEHDWLERLSVEMRPDVDVVSGFFRPLMDSLQSSTIGAVITPTLEEIAPERFLPSSRSVAFRKSAWDAVGGYPEWLDYCEDLVFDLALKKSGSVFAFAPTAIANWDARPNLRAFSKQYFRYARGDGKANLWARRHAIRYASYLGGAILLAGGVRTQSLAPVLLLGALGLGYLRRPLRRVWVRRRQFRGWFPAAVLLTPVVVALGDFAKMAGYPLGVVWRIRRRLQT